ncbi:MAG: hypothetical protein RIT02_2437 [Planctomycetota bacterium]|jgi:hypothetical protein
MVSGAALPAGKSSNLSLHLICPQQLTRPHRRTCANPDPWIQSKHQSRICSRGITPESVLNAPIGNPLAEYNLYMPR